MMLHTKYQGLRPCGLRQDNFSCFPCIGLCKTCDPQGEPIFLKELFEKVNLEQNGIMQNYR